MSSGSSVSFAFQADVANTGSLLHLLTGRALKALSDGGVDFYSVVVAVTLGKGFEIRSSLGNTVPAHVKSKRGIQSVLSKVLSIGWGQPGLAVAMTQTKAGVNALVLIDALAYGSTDYQAAECFSSLLSLRGCEADNLPNVDVLKNMIGYLSPFLLDLGFSRVVAHITTTATRAINLNRPRNSEYLERLERAGDAPTVAGAISQLMLTSGRKESSYMPTRMRGAWLSAFASHVLGMAVELRLYNVIIWESAGSNGTAIFELGEYQADGLQFQVIIGLGVTITELPETEDECSMLDSCLPIGTAFGSLIDREPDIDVLLEQDIRRAIYRLCLEKLKSGLEEYYIKTRFRLHGYFKYFEALKETLNAFGFENTIFDSVDNQASIEEIPDAIDGIKALGLKAYDRLKSACGIHGDSTPNIKTYPRTDVLLKFPDDIKCVSYGPEIPKEDDLSVLLNLVDNTKLGGEQELSRHEILGYSGKSFTVCYTCILGYDCFDNRGRFLTLLPGRASVEGAFRSTIVEYPSRGIHAQLSDVPVSTLLAPGLTLTPHHAPSGINTFMEVSFNERNILLSFKIGREKASAGIISISECFQHITQVRIMNCPHEPTSEFQVQKDHNLAVLGFGAGLGAFNSKTRRNQNTIRLIGLRGNKLEQVLTLGMLGSNDPYNPSSFFYDPGCILQLGACLKCCIATAEDRGSKIIIMGG
ncbi:hypothetical protein F5Y00DRAFT_271152 [Daldinia vernicosa]|uniref:uncharacterized protein n=1 Tax=Daldinia vernicosa TaxID=114800 RepID=UPI002007F5E4|nr:uncharacterized protein F5Y00DRAFT_271152 [Daldinia vernicosa]KAI0847413.1 hypothetical protein F5Y00DRAFT_271152 [Daldinia vernicosa]